MRRMSGDPLLILPRRLSAQELRYEEGHGQEYVRGMYENVDPFYTNAFDVSLTTLKQIKPRPFLSQSII